MAVALMRCLRFEGANKGTSVCHIYSHIPTTLTEHLVYSRIKQISGILFLLHLQQNLTGNAQLLLTQNSRDDCHQTVARLYSRFFFLFFLCVLYFFSLMLLLLSSLANFLHSLCSVKYCNILLTSLRIVWVHNSDIVSCVS